MLLFQTTQQVADSLQVAAEKLDQAILTTLGWDQGAEGQNALEEANELACMMLQSLSRPPRHQPSRSVGESTPTDRAYAVLCRGSTASVLVSAVLAPSLSLTIQLGVDIILRTQKTLLVLTLWINFLT